MAPRSLCVARTHRLDVANTAITQMARPEIGHDKYGTMRGEALNNVNRGMSPTAFEVVDAREVETSRFATYLLRVPGIQCYQVCASCSRDHA